MSGTPEPSSVPFHLPKASENFSRFCHLILTVCSDLFRDILSRYIKPADLRRELDNNKQILNNVTTSAQKKLLYPPPGGSPVSAKDLDLSLLYVLLRNICRIQEHQNGWGNDPKVGDNSLAAYIERIRILRNRICHSTIDDKGFKDIWNKLQEDIVNVEKTWTDGEKYERMFKRLHASDLTPSTLQDYSELFQKLIDEMRAENYEMKTRIGDLGTQQSTAAFAIKDLSETQEQLLHGLQGGFKGIQERLSTVEKNIEDRLTGIQERLSTIEEKIEVGQSAIQENMAGQPEHIPQVNRSEKGCEEAREVCENLRKKYGIKGWPGYEGNEIVIVAFSKAIIENFPHNFQSYRVILRTDDDNTKPIKRAPRLLNEDVRYCKPIIGKYGPTLMKEHSNISMIIPSPYRLQKGEAITRVCIAIYCRGKGIIPLNEDVFPATLECIEVDVREGYCRFGMKNEDLSESEDFHESLRIGVQIGPLGGPTGTLGGFLIREQKTCFLTCAHVVIPCECLIENYPDYTHAKNNCERCRNIEVLQPAMHFSTLGNVKEAVFKHGCEVETSVDAAIVAITDESRLPKDPYMTKQPNEKTLRAAGFTNDNPPRFSTGEIVHMMKEPYIGHMAIKCGAKTDLTYGLLALDGGIFRMDTYHSEKLPGIHGQLFEKSIVMYGQYLVQFMKDHAFFENGDSGSLVFMHYKGTLKCIGMAIGVTTDGGGCIVTPIEAILDAFNHEHLPPFLRFNDSEDCNNDDGNGRKDSDRFHKIKKRKLSERTDNQHSTMEHSGVQWTL